MAPRKMRKPERLTKIEVITITEKLSEPWYFNHM